MLLLDRHGGKSSLATDEYTSNEAAPACWASPGL